MDGGRNRRGQGEADWILMSGCNAIKPALSPSSHFSWQLLSDPRKHHQTSINLLTKKPRKKKKTSYLYSHKIKSWHGQKVSQSMLNTEKNTFYRDKLSIILWWRTGGLQRKGKNEWWIGRKCRIWLLWASFMHVCPYYSLIAEKNPTWTPISWCFLVSLIYCFLSRLTEDPYFIVSYNCCVW